MKGEASEHQQHHHRTTGRRCNNAEDFRCCFCCHVRTATICFGMWHIVMHVLFFVLLTMVLHHQSFLKSQDIQDIDTNLVKATPSSYILPEKDDKTLSVLEHSSDSGQDYYTLYIRHRKWGVQDVKLALFITTFTFILALMLVYGSIKGRPIYLMPFFCFQVLDLGISFVTLASYFSYMPDARYIIANNPSIPFREQLLQMDLHWLSLIFLAIFIGSIVIQAYFLNLVWSCYKFLVMREFMRSNITSYVINDSESQMPPDYETATKLPEYYAAFQAPPPPYPAEDRTETVPQ